MLVTILVLLVMLDIIPIKKTFRNVSCLLRNLPILLLVMLDIIPIEIYSGKFPVSFTNYPFSSWSCYPSSPAASSTIQEHFKPPSQPTHSPTCHVAAFAGYYNPYMPQSSITHSCHSFALSGSYCASPQQSIPVVQNTVTTCSIRTVESANRSKE